MMKITVTLVRIAARKALAAGSRLFQQVPESVRKREDMMPPHIASPVPEQSWLADAEAQAFIIREMPLEIVLVAHLKVQMY